VFGLEDPDKLDNELKDISVVLHCAGPYIFTARPMVEACLRSGTHYLDITGEIPVYKDIASRDVDAREKGVMLLPGVGFDVAPTDCLAVHLKKRLPSATHLTLAFQSIGPAGLPPGTQRTMFEMIPYGFQSRVEGKLQSLPRSKKYRYINFGNGEVEATRLTWGDVFTAYVSTGIPNIESYLVLSPSMKKGMAFLGILTPLFQYRAVRNFFKRGVKPGPSMEECDMSTTHVWGEVRDGNGQKAVARLFGPEGGLVWTSKTAIASVHEVLRGNVSAGYQTPATAFGPEFVLESEGVSLEDL
jgi:short subunit dehydrogenase-like uncharacterized protein